MIIKICGIKHPKQAIKISNYGATHIGVVFFEKSPRNVNLDEIKAIKSSIPEKVKLVAVVVDPEYETVNTLLKYVDVIQFHGNEDITFLQKFPKEKIIKAFRLKQEDQLKDIEKYAKGGYLILIDSFSKGYYGGTGKQIDLNLAKKVSQITDRFILSGGLSVDNISYLINEIKPYGIDASSRLEIKPGIKDLEKVKKFIKIAREKFGD